jgi:hypothetical protein
VSNGAVRDQLNALNGSLLLLAQDDVGSYWTYKHPTVSDAFAQYVARNPELVEIYLRGAKPESIVHEVVCANVTVSGATVVVPDSLHSLLADRLTGMSAYYLISFLSYRSNRAFSARMLKRRPDLLDRLRNFSTPLKEDPDANLVATLHEQGLLPEDLRLNFVETLRRGAVERVDASFLEDPSLGAVLTVEEKESILAEVETEVLEHIGYHVGILRDEWSADYSPEDHFEDFQKSVKLFVAALPGKADHEDTLSSMRTEVRMAVREMNKDYEPTSSTSAPTASSTLRSTPLDNLFRDVDE